MGERRSRHLRIRYRADPTLPCSGRPGGWRVPKSVQRGVSSAEGGKMLHAGESLAGDRGSRFVPCLFVLNGSGAVSGLGRSRKRLPCPGPSPERFLPSPKIRQELGAREHPPGTAPSSFYSAAPSSSQHPHHTSMNPPRRWVYCQIWWWEEREEPSNCPDPRSSELRQPTPEWVLQSILVAAAVSRGWKSPRPRAATAAANFVSFLKRRGPSP